MTKAPTPPTESPTLSPNNGACAEGEFWNVDDEECSKCPSDFAMDNCEGFNKNQCRSKANKKHCRWCEDSNECKPGKSGAVCDYPDMYAFCKMTKAPTPPTQKPTVSPNNIHCSEGEFWNIEDEECSTCPSLWAFKNCEKLDKRQCRSNKAKKNCKWCNQLNECKPGKSGQICNDADLYHVCTEAPTVSPTNSPSVSPTASPSVSPTVHPTAGPTAGPTIS